MTAREGTRVARAKLCIVEWPVKVECPRCQTVRRVHSAVDRRCIECDAKSDIIVGGEELDVVALQYGPFV